MVAALWARGTHSGRRAFPGCPVLRVSQCPLRPTPRPGTAQGSSALEMGSNKRWEHGFQQGVYLLIFLTVVPITDVILINPLFQ